MVVDDDMDIRNLVGMVLSEEGFDVIKASGIEEAEGLLEVHDILVALVDLRLRDKDGLDLVRKLAMHHDVGIMILSGKGGTLDRVIGIEVGADDYITKPFDNRELLARVKRRAARVRAMRDGMRSRHESEPVAFGDWTIDHERHAVFDKQGAQANLSESEFRTLACLVRNRGSVLSRDELYNYVVGPGIRDPLDRRIDVYVSSLRKKLGLAGPSAIRTVHRVGYIVD
ncbi:response regulator transcription factor [Acuticoccus mangrovi]|uniref:Response regulator transcription factor n=1 Tax=Acuticoccus mangrovi TaxID=2796142 RepID=A0A934MHC6_9HYPH|nr:response regulator transcription factor [Acuticoccus mangrovi]MBJ3775916.1 response regulator transcription factor [Acuticoccus mangrovi]